VALRIVAACADGLDYAHQQKVIHRDVKPENVMYDPATGTVHLIDFGLAAEIRESLSRYSQGFVAQAGTERYMSPEQWLGQLQNAGCDQWALGVMAWELLTGVAPYHGSGMTLGFAVCQAPVPKLPSQLSVLQPVFERVLQKQACDRYGTCREFVEELTGLLQPRAVPVSQPVPPRVPPVTRPELLFAPFSGSAAASAQAAWGNLLGCSVQWQDEFGHDLRLIPAGEFTMGCSESPATLQQAGFDVPLQGNWESQLNQEGPPHRVQLTRPFYLGAGPVTRGQFAEFVRASGYRAEAETDGKGSWGYNFATTSFELRPDFTWRKTGFYQTDAHPVVNVSWNDAQAYIQWLNQRCQLSSWVRRYRLPSEAEWEYSCGAGTPTRFHTGDHLASVEGFANVLDVSVGKAFPKRDYQKWQKFDFDDRHAFTSVPGAFSGNGFGLYDMHGNVWDWCSDWYDGNYYGKSPVADPPGPSSGSSRVLRGGGWNSGPLELRTCYRYGSTPGSRLCSGGFRVLCELE
jgi:formylglycine-generating enzyme required for sulfatase activity